MMPMRSEGQTVRLQEPGPYVLRLARRMRPDEIERLHQSWRQAWASGAPVLIKLWPGDTISPLGEPVREAPAPAGWESLENVR